MREGFFEHNDFESVVEHLPEYLKDFSRFGYATGGRKGSIASLAWTDVGTDVLYLRAQNSKTRKPETIPLVGQLKEIIDRRRETRVSESSTGEARFAKYVFHRDGEPVGDFRKAWATACKKAGVTCRLFTTYAGAPRKR